MRPVAYLPQPRESNARCYMCFPVHRADWISSGTGSLAVCDFVFQRLVRDGKAEVANSQPEETT